MKPTFLFLMVMVAGFWIAGVDAKAAPVDHDLYATLLSRHVKDGLVDYRGIQGDEALLDRYLDVLAAVDPESLSADHQFAFYVNAYNAWTLKLILSRYPDVRSIKELGTLFRSPWKKKIARIDGGLLTLDQIEHDILRKRFKDPRVHFAVNCASRSCPPLQGEPFTGDRLDEQLNRSARAFVNDSRFNRLEGDTLWVSKLFDWFEQDFNDDVIGFFIQFAHPPLGDRLLKNKGRIRVRYLDYDWTLNGT
ncbi:DUF547 domain-containing protein [Desulfosarcina alkanivorans]|uniref:DUF547 domain-containing protein n=1 Tax=Desulfosarcina alkanivorans TaxID=571177 RepID=A0A5K7YJK4_9BACT|nr:DUF547 domain-containing protein [Desulfosarcina alkanivorans]BBO69048.1 DUF547 domain-containing protein [Desulfosarcina alkanivorans]